MAKWHPSQVSFAAGELTARAISRVDSDIYRQAALLMENMMPRSQGPAVRTPGTVYLADLTANGLTGREIPFLTIDGRRALVILQDRYIEIRSDIDGSGGSGQLPLQIVNNPDFNSDSSQAREAWTYTPTEYTSKDGARLGCRYEPREFNTVLSCICRNWKYPNLDSETFEVKQTFSVPNPSDEVIFDYRIVYEANPGLEGEAYTFRITVGTTDGGADVLDRTFTGPVGTVLEESIAKDLPANYQGDLYVRFFCSADEFASTPVFAIDRFRASIEALPVGDEPLIDIEAGLFLYAESALEDIQFLQSPYGNKEVVITHPAYPPRWLFYDPDAGQYRFENIPFIDPPSVWRTENYPRACGTFQGRLLLGGTQQESETCWGSRNNNWDDFSTTVDPNDPNLLTPDSAIEFTTIYRSPIQWIFGQKDLLIGTEELEYVVISDSGLLQPGDIDVRLHSGHGSRAIQPTPIGKYVAFAAERGTRMRGAQRVFSDTGWIAPDLSERAPHLLSSGIARMTRMRNPNELVLALTNNGKIAMLSLDEASGVYGWNRFDIGGTVIDICTLPQQDGTDALMLLVRRVVQGQTKLYLETVVDWAFEREWQYLNCAIRQGISPPGNVITGLDHLEGERVQVVSGRTFYGAYRVNEGKITLEDDNGVPFEPVSSATVGYASVARMRLLPPITPSEAGGVNSKKRYSDVVVRTLASRRPRINGTLPYDRDPVFPMDLSPPAEYLRDTAVANLGTDNLALVEIEEGDPFRLEVVSISGTLKSEKI